MSRLARRLSSNAAMAGARVVAAEAGAVLGMRIESDERRQPDRCGVSLIDRRPLQGAPNGAHEANGNVRLCVNCFTPETAKLRYSYVLCRTKPYGEFRLRAAEIPAPARRRRILPAHEPCAEPS
jgi:hypothetical protein